MIIIQKYLFISQNLYTECAKKRIHRDVIYVLCVYIFFGTLCITQTSALQQ